MRFPDPAKAKEFFDQKMTFTTGPVELNRTLNLPNEKWHTAQGLKKDKINVLYCYTKQCHLAANAALEFAARGFPVMEMEGGFEAWKDNDLDVEK
jgi:rhodanese-related sulfurtransferase